MRNPQYNKSVNIDINKSLEIKYQKYQPYRQTKLFTNNIKIALFTSASSLALSQIFKEQSPICYAIFTTSLSYSLIKLHINKNSKKHNKKMILK